MTLREEAARFLSTAAEMLESGVPPMTVAATLRDASAVLTNPDYAKQVAASLGIEYRTLPLTITKLDGVPTGRQPE